ncbi:unnamed protein product, partial [Meganyctiphanes norvegica]
MAPSAIVALLCLLATASAGIVAANQLSDKPIKDGMKMNHVKCLNCEYSEQGLYLNVRWQKRGIQMLGTLSRNRSREVVQNILGGVDIADYRTFYKKIEILQHELYPLCYLLDEKYFSNHYAKSFKHRSPSSLDLQCSTSCELPTNVLPKWGVEVGNTYTYSYSGKSSVSLSGKGSSNGQWSTEVQITHVNPCNFAISFKKSIANTQVEKYPFVVGIKNGVLDQICYHPEDDNESVNIKKGIASALQNSLTSFSEQPLEHSIIETDVFGRCPTTYKLETIEQNTVVTKEKNHKQCEVQLVGVPSTSYQFDWTVFPLRESKSSCRQEIGNGIFTSITCTDKKSVFTTYGTVEASQESKLQFVSESNDKFDVSSIQINNFFRKSFTYEYKKAQKNSALVEKLETSLSNICSKIQGQGSNEVASLLTGAIKLLKYVPEEAIVEALKNIRSGKFCADYTRLEALYLDTIAFVGESGSLKVLAQEVAAGRVTGGRTALYTAALHLIWTPNVHHIKALKPIFAMEKPASPLLLAAATLVNSYCDGKSACMDEAPIREVLEILANKLDTQCTPAFSKENPSMALANMKTLGNIGHMTPKFAGKLVKCLSTEGVEVNVRFAAAMAVKAAPCMQQIKGALLPIAFDQNMNTELRIGSYLAVVKCSLEADLQNIVDTIKTDDNKQVHAFILSHLSNLQETNWPMKFHLKELLKNVDIPQTYNSNLFKYSRNIEMSFDSSALGLGTEVDSNIVYAPESYIPRILNMELNMNLPLSRVSGIHKIAEVGARVEGLDNIFEKAFGPESYLYRTPLKAIIKDTSLFIQQNGGKLFKDLEVLLKKSETFDLDSLVKSVLGFLEGKSIKLPKADLYAKLMGQEWAFLTTSGPLQELHFNNALKAVSAAVTEAMVGAKDLNMETARAAHLQFLYGFPTIQGIPLMMNFETTAVTTMAVQTQMKSKTLIKIIPSISIAIEGYIGYGNKINNGIKMKHSIYTTNGVAVHGVISNGEELELKFELPDKMELINIDSEVYYMKTDAKFTESRVQHDLQDNTRLLTQECSSILETFTGLNICFNVNVPHVLNTNSFPLGQPMTFRIHLQKSDNAMKGYRFLAKLKNKPTDKVLKIVAGTYGTASSSETSVTLGLTKSADKYLASLNVQSTNMNSAVEASVANQVKSATLQVTVNHKYGMRSPVVAAVKFDLQKAENEYKLSGFAGLSQTLSDNNIIFFAQIGHIKEGHVIIADIIARSELKPFPLAVEFGVDLPVNALWGIMVRKAGFKIGSEEVGAAFYFKYLMEGNTYKAVSEIDLPSLMKPVKTTGAIQAVEFMQFETLVDVEMGATALLHAEGPFSLVITKEALKHQFDLNISGPFEETYKISHAIFLSLNKILHRLEARHGTTAIAFIEMGVDKTNLQETSCKVIVNLPYLAEAEFNTAVTSGLIHSTMNILVLPKTSSAQRLKGNADVNLAENKIKGDIYWNADKDIAQKLSIVLGYSLDSATGTVLVKGDVDVAGLLYGLKVEGVAGSPMKFFLGNNGITIAITLPSKKTIVAKTICSIEYNESLVILKPLLALHTVNEHKYEISGSVTLKKLPAFLNFEISKEVTVLAPEIEKVTIVANLKHEDTNDGCLILFKVGITETFLNKPIDVEIRYDFSSVEYTGLVAIKAGSSITNVVTNVVPISGLKAFEVTVDATLPLPVLKSLGLKVVKSADGAITTAVTKNRQTMVKFQYIMSSAVDHTLIFECPSRTVELSFSLAGNEMIIKAFPEKNTSTRMAMVVIKVTKKAGAGLIESFVKTPALAKEMRITAKVVPTLGNVMNVDIQLPISEMTTILVATVEELKNILKDLVNDGLLPDLDKLVILAKKLLAELPEFVEIVKAEVNKFISYYYATILKLWIDYEGDIMALWNTLKPEIIHIWGVLETEVPVIVNRFMEKIKNTSFWKVLYATYDDIMTRYP